MRRASKAVDRMILAASKLDKLKASRWAEAWGRLAGVRRPTNS